MQSAHPLKAAAALDQANAAIAIQFENPRKIKNFFREKLERNRDRADLP
jgi:hypothetical protein